MFFKEVDEDKFKNLDTIDYLILESERKIKSKKHFDDVELVIFTWLLTRRPVRTHTKKTPKIYTPTP